MPGFNGCRCDNAFLYIAIIKGHIKVLLCGIPSCLYQIIKLYTGYIVRMIILLKCLTDIIDFDYPSMNPRLKLGPTLPKINICAGFL